MDREDTYTVGEITEVVRRVIDRAFPAEVWVQGEIRDLSRAASGHVYFSLVDPGDDPGAPPPALLPVTLFASDKLAINRVLQRSGAGRFEDGIAVRIRGRLSHYAARGTVQLRMLWIDTEYTLGRLAAARARVIESLAADGMLDRNAALPFPLVPLRIGLVTSEGSAAHADFMEELLGSGFRFEVTVFDTRVQGVDAEPSLVSSLAAAASCDVIALVRGGGSRTDLAAFDREAVARAVAISPVPVVVGIGHEIDETVVDRVAARSYRTPTACAVGLVADVAAYVRRLDEMAAAVIAATRRRVLRADRDVAAATKRLGRSSLRLLRAAGGDVDRSAGRIPANARRSLRLGEQAVTDVSRRIVAGAASHADRAAADADLLTLRLGAVRRVLDHVEAELATAGAVVAGRDPALVLRRGWTLTTDAAGTIIRDPAVVERGDSLATIFSSGRVTSIVETVTADEETQPVVANRDEQERT